MNKIHFSAEELSELEALEIRGGAASPNAAQDECSNHAKGCGSGAIQKKCSNHVDGCGPVEIQNCPSIKPVEDGCG